MKKGKGKAKKQKIQTILKQIKRSNWFSKIISNSKKRHETAQHTKNYLNVLDEKEADTEKGRKWEVKQT